MERLDFQRSRLKTAGLVVMAFAFVAGGWFLAKTGDDVADRFVGWCCVAFFGICALVGSVVSTDRRFA